MYIVYIVSYCYFVWYYLCDFKGSADKNDYLGTIN